MGRSKLFNGVAAGVAGSFIGRNNDYNGYWTLGILKWFAEANGVDVVDIPLKPQPPINTLELITRLSHRYREMLDRITICFGLDPSRIKTANIKVTFVLDDDLANRIPRRTRGEPLVCEVSIVDNSERRYECMRYTCCEAHDPLKERRSARRDAY